MKAPDRLRRTSRAQPVERASRQADQISSSPFRLLGHPTCDGGCQTRGTAMNGVQAPRPDWRSLIGDAAIDGGRDAHGWHRGRGWPVPSPKLLRSLTKPARSRAASLIHGAASWEVFRHEVVPFDGQHRRSSAIEGVNRPTPHEHAEGFQPDRPCKGSQGLGRPLDIDTSSIMDILSTGQGRQVSLGVEQKVSASAQRGQPRPHAPPAKPPLPRRDDAGADTTKSRIRERLLVKQLNIRGRVAGSCGNVSIRIEPSFEPIRDLATSCEVTRKVGEALLRAIVEGSTGRGSFCL